MPVIPQSMQPLFITRPVISIIIPVLAIFTLISRPAIADVTAFDEVTIIHNPVRLKALTKGRFFSEGGKLVKFHIDEKHVGTTLSGGDGYAFLKYTPKLKGLIKIKVTAEKEKYDEAFLLVTDSREKIVLISIESALFESPLSFKPMEGAEEAINTISNKYRIIYLTSMIGKRQSRKWLRENKLQESVIFSWTGTALIEEFRETGISLYAMVAGPEMLDEVEDIRKFSFLEMDGIEPVESWEEVIKQLENK